MVSAGRSGGGAVVRTRSKGVAVFVAESASFAATLPPAIVGRTVVLRPPSRDDLLTFFAWRADGSQPHLLSQSRRIPTYEEFIGEMERHQRQSIMLVVLDKEVNEPIGFVQAYNLNLEAGWCFATVYMTQDYRQSNRSTEAYICLLDFVFRRFGLRKVYVDVYEFGLDSMKLLMTGGFVEEGRFREHSWFDGRYWDVVRLAVYRDGWTEGRRKVGFLLGVGQEAAALLEEQQGASEAGGEEDGRVGP